MRKCNHHSKKDQSNSKTLIHQPLIFPIYRPDFLLREEDRPERAHAEGIERHGDHEKNHDPERGAGGKHGGEDTGKEERGFGTQDAGEVSHLDR